MIHPIGQSSVFAWRNDDCTRIVSRPHNVWSPSTCRCATTTNNSGTAVQRQQLLDYSGGIKAHFGRFTASTRKKQIDATAECIGGRYYAMSILKEATLQFHSWMAYAGCPQFKLSTVNNHCRAMQRNWIVIWISSCQRETITRKISVNDTVYWYVLGSRTVAHVNIGETH